MNFMRCFEYAPWLRSLAQCALKFELLPREVYNLRAQMAQYTNEKLQRFVCINTFAILLGTNDYRRLSNPPKRSDFLQRMISEKQDWTGRSFQELTSQATALTVAGSETTATALSGITYYLCRNAEAYQKTASEVRCAFTEFDQITGRATENLAYLKAVIDEGLRLYPPIAAGLPRISPGETVDGYFVPKGTVVSVNTWVAGHVESNFRDAFKFIPERWLDAECPDDKAASQPFLMGSRVCLGRKYVKSRPSCQLPSS